MKALYALGFVLFSFAAPAQTLETAIAEYHPGDCSGATTQQSAVSVQIIATEPTIEQPGEAKSTEAKSTEAKSTEAKSTEADGVATTEPNDAKEASVGAVQPSDESSTAKHSTLRDDKPTVDGTSGQGAMPAQIIATEPTVEKPTEAKPTGADGVATAEPNDAKEASVGAVQPSDENSPAKHSTLRDDEPIADATSGQGATPAQIIATEPTIEKPTEAKPTEADGVATTEPNDAKEASVGAVQLGETKPGEAKPTETDGVATTEPNAAKDAPVQAVQPGDENATAKHSTLRDDKPTVDDTSGQNAMPAQIVATEPTIEQPGEAKPTEAKPTEAKSTEAKSTEAKSTEAKPTETDGVATTALKDAEDAPVEVIQPSDENATVKSDREVRN